MERLLVLRLEVAGCTAEALFNGVPLIRASATAPVATVPVHEFAFAGGNTIELVAHPAAPGAPDTPEPMLSDGQCFASLRLLLPRTGGVAHPGSARTLAQLDWAPPADAVFEAPVRQQRSVELPINFPRWRWIDAPVVPESPTLKADVARYLLDIAVGLRRGNPEPLIQASRLRLEDLAQAYQRNLADDVGRLRVHIQQLHAAEPLQPALPAAGKLLLRAVAGGRLLECLRPDGSPLLQSPTAGGGSIAWPLRLAAIEGRFYVLR